MLIIDLETARRFILGKQGLWPGRRWRGARGTEQGMRAMEYLQLDPLQVTARSQDIALYGRVLDYTPGLWETVTYRQRKFFVRNSAHADHRLRHMAITEFGAWRSPIPAMPIS